ncbi:MAG: hypothetical protein GWN62_30725 [Aliifodinibius sp.]|nr:hypothetical protein [Fodinibius sp.]
MNYTLNQLEMLLRFSTNQWNNAITSACPNCERSMWLEKVIDKENQLILDVEDWIEKEVERLRMCS